jgi:branched-chain amino acid transport system ATP-binding protein
MSAPILNVKDLNKSFGAVTAAHDISVAIQPGTCTGLIGTNGAGKTTFVNMITGYLKPDTGSIEFNGQNITKMTPRDISRIGVTRSFQIPQLYASMTTLENLEMGFGVLALMRNKRGLFVGSDKPVPGYGNQTIRQLAEEAMERFGLSAFRDQVTRTLPGGTRKLIDIAMAMATKPKVLLLDEPTSGVSSEEKFDIMDMVMRVVKADGTTVLFVEHDMEIVSQHADRVLAFYDGTIIVDEPPESALKNDLVLQYIVGNTQALSTTGQNDA